MARFRLDLPYTVGGWVGATVSSLVGALYCAVIIGVVTAPMVLLVWMVFA